MSPKRIKSRQKGASGERDWSAWLRARHVGARRGVQFSGGPDSPDVVHGDLPGLHAEVKRVERGLCLYQATDQAASEAPPERRPYVAHRKNRKGWLVTMRAEDWLALSCKAALVDEDRPVRLLVVDWPRRGVTTADPTRYEPVLVACSVAGDACLIHAVVKAEEDCPPVDLATVPTAERLSLYEATKRAWRRAAGGPLVDDLSGPVGGP